MTPSPTFIQFLRIRNSMSRMWEEPIQLSLKDLMAKITMMETTKTSKSPGDRESSKKFLIFRLRSSVHKHILVSQPSRGPYWVSCSDERRTLASVMTRSSYPQVIGDRNGKIEHLNKTGIRASFPGTDHCSFAGYWDRQPPITCVRRNFFQQI